MGEVGRHIPRKGMVLTLLGLCTAVLLFAALQGNAGGSGSYERGREGSRMEKEELQEALVIYSPHPLDFINPVVSEFELRTGIRVQVKTGGTEALLRQLEEGKESGCDIFWGGSLSTAMGKQELFRPYISVNEPAVREEFKNREGNMTRFTDIPSVIMVNTNLAGDVEIQGYADLLKPELKGRIAMCSPASSSSAFEHLINMLYAMGDGDPEQGWDYVERFCENLDGILAGSSSDVYQGVAEGRYAAGLTFEEGGANYVAEGGPVKLVYMEEGVISKPDVVCIPRGTDRQKEAEAFVDFVTGRDAQSVISGKLNRRSVRLDVEEPSYLPDKDSLLMLEDDSQVVAEHKEEWQRHFTELFEEASGR